MDPITSRTLTPDEIKTIEAINSKSQELSQIPGNTGTGYKAININYDTPVQTTTMGDAFRVNEYSPDQADTEAYNRYKESQDVVTDPRRIREDYIALFQDRINALENVYNQQLATAKREGLGRVGSGTAILARRGLAGSPRGGAIQEGIVEQNRGIENDILAAKGLAISNVLGQASQMAVEEANRRAQAKAEGAKSYIEFLKTQDERKLANVDTNIAAMIAQGVDINDINVDEIAKTLGVSRNTIIARFDERKRAIMAEDAKNKPFEEGGYIFEYDPATGGYKRTVTAVKAGAGTGSGSGIPGNYSPEIKAAAQSILDGKSKLNEYPSAQRLQINAALSDIYRAEGGNELVQGAYDSILKLENGAGMAGAVGAKGPSSFFGLKSYPIAGTDAANFKAELDKLIANIKLINIKYLKGTGAISDEEGRTLENAGTSLSLNLSEEAFKEELARVKAALEKANNIKTTSITPGGNMMPGNIVSAPDGTLVEIVD